MGNVEAHDFDPVRPDERKELNLSRQVSFKQFCKHLNGEVHESCLRELPYNIRDSVCLYEIMKAAFNMLTEVPPELPLRLPHLHYLDLSHNQLTEIPHSFGLLFHLKTLLLQHNRLRALPETFTRLVKLEKVDLSYNLLRELPEDLGDMENLQRLSVSHNKLKHLPVSLGSSRKLRLLLAERNRLDLPPQSVCDEGSESTLQYIRKLYLSAQDKEPPKPVLSVNEFPRHRSNQLHSPVSNPHSAQMQYIQEQTYTTNTPSRIKTPLMPPLGASSYDAIELRDRILGLIFGAAIGDIVGLATRWMTPDQVAFHYDVDMIQFTDIIRDEHRVPWYQGDWSSNFDVFMLVLDSLINWAGVVDELDFAKRLVAYRNQGFPELGDSSGVLLSTVMQQVVSEETFLTDPHGTSERVLQLGRTAENGVAGSDCESRSSSSLSSLSDSESFQVHESSSCKEFGTDNGSIIRAAILGIPNFHDLQEVEENSVRICRATHADPGCLASCVFVSLLVAKLLQGHEREMETTSCEQQIKEAQERAAAYLTDVQHQEHFLASLQVTQLSQLKAREKDNMSHTYKPMMAAVLALGWQGTFCDFVMHLAREGGDSNSNGCVAGAVMGFRSGYSKLPKTWLEGLRPRQARWLNLRVNLLLDMMGLP